ncbi:MAG: AAA family ATPase [bacterium]|nr:AAA family ATPase [bacterium]
MSATMDNNLSIAVFNTEEDQQDALREAVGKISLMDLRLETDRWEDLEAELSGGGLNAVLVNLDPDIEFGVNLVRRIVDTVPEMSVLGVSRRTDPQTIISAMRAGCAQFVCAPVDQHDFRNAVERIRAARMAMPHSSYRICVVGASGGVGATTLSCNLSMELAQVSKRICALVDLNLEYGDASFTFDCDPRFSIADLCGTGTPIDRTMVESAIHQLPCDVALLCRPTKATDARQVTPEGVEQALRVLSAMHQNVVVDLPRSFSFLSAAALEGADLIMVVAQLSIPSIRNASRVYDVLQEMGANEAKIEIVLNRCRAEHQRITPGDVEQHFRRPIFAMIPNDYRRVTAAADFGHPIVADAPNSPVRLAIHELAKTITQGSGTGEDVKPNAANRGLLQRWWGGGKKTTSPA